MLLAIHAYRWGWQGGTGWHAIRHPRATPCFTGISTLSDPLVLSVAALQQAGGMRIRVHSRANRCVRGLSRALACKQGVATCTNACHPLFYWWFCRFCPFRPWFWPPTACLSGNI